MERFCRANCSVKFIFNSTQSKDYLKTEIETREVLNEELEKMWRGKATGIPVLVGAVL